MTKSSDTGEIYHFQNNPTVSLGALPPPEGTSQIGDRADKRCVEAATEVMSKRIVGLVLFKDMEAAIDAYLATAAEHGWKLK